MKKLLTLIILASCIAGWGQNNLPVLTDIEYGWEVDTINLDIISIAEALEYYEVLYPTIVQSYLIGQYIEHCEQDSVYVEPMNSFYINTTILDSIRWPIWPHGYYQKGVIPTLEGYYEWLKNLLK